MMLDLLKADNGMSSLMKLTSVKVKTGKAFTGAFIDDVFLIDYLTRKNISILSERCTD